MAELQETYDLDRDSLVHEIPEKIHSVDGTSSSSSGGDSGEKKTASPAYVKPKRRRFFEQEKPVRNVSGEDNSANAFMWKNKNISVVLLGMATAAWVFFELLEYHLITLICHLAILALAVSFFWSNASIIINERPPHFPKIRLPQEPFIEFATVLCSEMNDAISVLREIASVRDLKKFLEVTAVLWVISIVGSLCNFMTLFYILFIFLYTVPALYEKYEDNVVGLADRAMVIIKKLRNMFDAKVVRKIPIWLMKEKRA